MSEFCRRRQQPDYRLCGKPAEMVVWGKLFPPEALGPRCYDCAAKDIGHSAASDISPGYAIYRIPKEDQ